MLLDWLLGPAFAWASISSPTPTRRYERHFDVNNHPDDQTEKRHEGQTDQGARRVVKARLAREEDLASKHVNTFRRLNEVCLGPPEHPGFDRDQNEMWVSRAAVSNRRASVCAGLGR